MHLDRVPRRFHLLLCVAFVGVVLDLTSAQTLAQQPAPQADPADYGLIMPQAPAKALEDRRVVVKDRQDKLVVAQARFEIGDRLLLLMPDGHLTSVPTSEATDTERPFVAATKDQLAAELTGQRFKGFKTRQTKRYLYIYNTSEPFFVATSRILETMYPALYAYCKRQKIAVHDPEVPLVLIMFHTQDEFEKYFAMPPGVVAYYSAVSNYVVMYEQSKLLEVAPDMAVKQSISTIAHEGVHQILHNIGVQQRLSRWPLWTAEGLAEYFAPTSFDKPVRWKGVGFVNDFRMKELEDFFRATGDPHGEMIEKVVGAQGLQSTGYAAAWALTHFLAEKRKEKFFAYLADVSKIEALKPSDREANLALFKKHFGSDFAGLEAALVKHLKQLPYSDPDVHQTHYVAMLQIQAGGGAMRRAAAVTASPTAAQTWQQSQLAAVPPQLQRGTRFTIQAFPNRNAAEGFANSWLSGK